MIPLSDIAKQLLADPKGLLAADESPKTSTKRFEALNIEPSEENRRLYRQMLFSTPNVAKYISGVILYDETIRQATDTGMPFTKLLQDQGITPGIKVDKGLVDFTGFASETITEGLDGLAERLSEYYKMGARFTKWRAAFSVDESNKLPTSAAIHANLNLMARYASLVQAAGMVPIVEPEVLYDGSHSLKACQDALSQVLKVLFDLLLAYKVDLSGVILKSSMVLAGKDNPQQATPAEVANATLQVFNQRVPKELAGIVFLSGGQSPEMATANLNAIGKAGRQPWPITFSYSRAVQDPVMSMWAGKAENAAKAQAIFEQLLANNSAARDGKFEPQKN
jgi:fructose-bisphosphate aldolase class I